jgi:ribosomal protein S18 acetylase RimI-like enzyme
VVGGNLLTGEIASGIFEQGKRPFLHVAESNEEAHRLYVNLGFMQRQMVDFRRGRRSGKVRPAAVGRAAKSNGPIGYARARSMRGRAATAQAAITWSRFSSCDSVT